MHRTGIDIGMRVSAMAATHHPTASSSSAGAAAAAASAAKTQECHICLEDLRADLAVSPCGHVYHEECITQALDVNKQCPICRRYATTRDVIRLFLEIPDTSSPSAGVAVVESACDGSPSRARIDPQIATLNERVSVLVERLQWQKKQHDIAVSEIKKSRHQTEQLLVDKQTLLQRVGSLDANKSDLLSKVAKYQIELSRLAENARQVSVNQSIISYLNTCDSDALEDEIQNPRELVVALKKACKFRHDQYQKAVKEKAQLKSMVQTLQTLQQQQPHHPQHQQHQHQQIGRSDGFYQDRPGKHKTERKRQFTAADYATPHTLELKKRKVTISPPGASVIRPHHHHNNNTTSSSTSTGSAPRAMESSSSFRASAYTDVATRINTPAKLPRAHGALSRSSFNPSQYGSYNLVPSQDPPVQASNHAVCRRGYDETGRLTNFFIPKEPTKQHQQQRHSSHSKARQTTTNDTYSSSSSATTASGRFDSRTTAAAAVADRRFALTNWLSKGQ